MDVFERFARAAASPDVDLGQAALMVAEAAEPGLDPAPSRLALDEFAVGVSDLTSLCRRLFVELGFQGDHAGYYEPDNSFLNRVIDRRKGIPISLAVLAMEVGRRAGVALEGIGMPSHFVVREPETGLYVDCYSARVLDERDLGALYRAANNLAADAPFPAEHHAAFTKPQILGRMLTNLSLIYQSRGEPANVEWVARLRLALPGAASAESLELARAMAAQGRVLEAAVELENRARTAPRKATELLAAARALRSRLN